MITGKKGICRKTAMGMAAALVLGTFVNGGAGAEIRAAMPVVKYYPVDASTAVKTGKRIKASEIPPLSYNEDFDGSFVIADVRASEMLAASNVFRQENLGEFSMLMTAYRMLTELDMSGTVTITAEQAESLSAEKVFRGADSGILVREGQKFGIEAFVTAYLFTGSDACRDILISSMDEEPEEFVQGMNFITKKLKTLNTHFSSVETDSAEQQYTTVYDLYTLINELMGHKAFMASIGTESADIICLEPDGTEAMLHCERTFGAFRGEQQTYQNCSIIGDMVFHENGQDQSRMMVLSGPEGETYLMLLMGVSDEEDIEEISSSLLEDVFGEALEADAQGILEELPLTEAALLPTESNDARYQYILGTDAMAYTIDDKPEGYESADAASRNMCTIQVPVWKMDEEGKKYASSYSLSVNKKLEENVKLIFNEIYNLDIQFPVKYLIGYSYRKVGGVGLVKSRLMSIHSFGAAIDINPDDADNDYYLGAGNDLRDKSNPYCIPDEVIETFEKYGWFWGGNFDICSDTMHFQYLGLDFLQYGEGEEFPLLRLQKPTMSGGLVTNLQQRLVRLGYMSIVTGKFWEVTNEALMEFQSDNGLEPTGETDYMTWETLLNKTNDMDFIF